jgi:hypothetical protein
MSASTVNFLPATARASAPVATAAISLPVSAAQATATAQASSVIVGSAILAYIVQTEPGYHLPAKHDDPVAFGLECTVIAAALFVTAKTFRL